MYRSRRPLLARASGADWRSHRRRSLMDTAQCWHGHCCDPIRPCSWRASRRWSAASPCWPQHCCQSLVHFPRFPGNWGKIAWTGWFFLVIFGSLIGYTTYMRLLRDIGASPCRQLCLRVAGDRRRTRCALLFRTGYRLRRDRHHRHADWRISGNGGNGQ